MKKALLVIDVQNEYFAGDFKVTYPENSFENILKSMDYAKQNNMTIILIQHENEEAPVFTKNSYECEIHEAVLKKPYDYIIVKNKPSSFYKTNLEEVLIKEGIQGIVICGYMTQMCCDTTAREAFHRGYKVEFLSDATGTIDIVNEVGSISSKELHNATLMAQSLGISTVLSVEKWMKNK